jgi:predicted ATPase/class 3 adenylate cyclase
MRPDLPTGTVTFLFTDVEGSTRLLHELGPERYAAALAEHRRVVRDAVAAHGGVEVDTQGDAFFVAFPTAPGALASAAAMTDALADGPIRVRVGLHTGTPILSAEGYVGEDVHRAARIAAAGHGGQVLVSATTASLVDVRLRDLGSHRFKDLSAPQPVLQLGDDQFPPLRTLYRTNLPTPSTEFLGRGRELSELGSLLARPEVRLLTLTGAGGTGKTRLALQAAAMASDEYPAGVYWVPLAPLRDPALVIPTASQAVGAEDGLADFIGDKRMLLLFDNFEQVAEASSELAAVLSSCPRLKLMVTSRESLHVTGEQEYAVSTLAHEEAIALFLARARALLSEFQTDDAVSEICRRLDDLPLAIELAAARVKVLNAGQILGRLERRLPLLTGGARDLPERQRTLRATIEWSYELLTPAEQELFARLAVFSGGCTLEAAEGVAGADLDSLQSLVDKSLVRHTEDRFWMLETVREYAQERFQDLADANEVIERHLDFYLALAERAYEHVAGASEWFSVMDPEHDNIRAAIDWAAEFRPRSATQLAAAVAEYWLLRGHGLEARERLIATLAGYSVRDDVRARALAELGSVVGLMDDDREALGYLGEALEVWRDVGGGPAEARALDMVGYCQIALGDLEAARIAFERSLRIRERAGAPELDIAESLGGLCQLLVASGDIERAEPMAKQLHEIGTRHGSRRRAHSGLHYLADCALIVGDYPEAEVRYCRALADAVRWDLQQMAPEELMGVAMAVAAQGDHRRAVRLAAAANARKAELGTTGTSLFWVELQDQHIGGARAHLTAAEREEAERAGREAPFESVLDDVLAPDGAASANGDAH